ncbi:MAG: epoxyqueuosine reductase QueH [Candidatus Magasanikbacteria bacterium]
MHKFLLHTCCAPCSIVIIEELKDKFDLTVFFYNPNIFPLAEYAKRKNEVVKVCEEWNVPMIDMDYDAQKWCEAIAGHEKEPEGMTRCELCFKFRLSKTAEYASKNNFHYFGTSLSSGRNKKAEVINPIGKAFGKYYKVNFYDVDWKKEGRQERGRKLVAERGIYRQNYCGCEFSLSKNI